MLTSGDKKEDIRLLINGVVFTDKEEWFEGLSEKDKLEALFHLDIWGTYLDVQK